MRLSRHRNSALALLLCASSSACVDTTVDEQLADVPWSEAGEQLALDLQGSWTVMSSQASDCPSELIVQPMRGQIRWTADEHRASLTALSAAVDRLDFFASDGNTLTRNYSLRVQDCVVNETSTIHIDELSGTFSRGRYEAHYQRNDGDACQLAAQGEALPAQCNVTVVWQAVRN